MKKIILLLVVLLMTVAFCTTAYAEGEPEVVVSTAADAMNGDEVVIDVSLKNNPGIAVICLDILYDAERLEPVSYTGSGLSDWTIGTAAVWVDAANTYYNGTVLTLVFKVKDDASDGKAEVTMDVMAANFDEVLVDFL